MKWAVCSSQNLPTNNLGSTQGAPLQLAEAAQALCEELNHVERSVNPAREHDRNVVSAESERVAQHMC